MKKAGFVTLFGPPNIGKSTLLNALMKRKLAPVSRRPQTTWRRIAGIITEDNAQAVIFDTPGLISAKKKIDNFIIGEIEKGQKDTDISIYIFSNDYQDIEIFKKKIRKTNSVLIAVINKIDLVKNKQLLLPLIKKIEELYKPVEVYPVSALKNIGIDELKKGILKYLPEQTDFYYPANYLSTEEERYIVTDLVREALFSELGEEVPYETFVELEEFKEREKGKDFISCNLIVKKNSQKAILIGKKGTKIKAIGEKARRLIEAFLLREVYLSLKVKVEKKWDENPYLVKPFFKK